MSKKKKPRFRKVKQFAGDAQIPTCLVLSCAVDYCLTERLNGQTAETSRQTKGQTRKQRQNAKIKGKTKSES